MEPSDTVEAKLMCFQQRAILALILLIFFLSLSPALMSIGPGSCASQLCFLGSKVAVDPASDDRR